jgi:RimJ/RimL family protein N-acetyltransferase
MDAQDFWAVRLRDSNLFIGWFHPRPDKISEGETEPGYRFQWNVRGCGLATEGSKVLLDQAFNEWGYQKVCARTMAINPAWRRVMEKAGLRFEPEFHDEMDVAHGWIEESERRAAKYSITRAGYCAARRGTAEKLNFPAKKRRTEG